MAEGSDAHTELLHFFDSKTTFAADCLEQETMMPRTCTLTRTPFPPPTPPTTPTLQEKPTWCLENVMAEFPESSPRKEEGNQNLNENSEYLK